MVVPRDPGPNYPWGNDPWPGTADDPKKGPSPFHYHDSNFRSTIGRIVSVRGALGKAPGAPGSGTSGGSKTAGDHLNDAGQLTAADFGTPIAGNGLYDNVQVAHNLMVGAHTNFLAAFDNVIAKLQATNANNADTESANVQVVDMTTVDTIEPGQPALPATPPGANNPGGQ